VSPGPGRERLTTPDAEEILATSLRVFVLPQWAQARVSLLPITNTSLVA
jgi:hypothetical protein